jgi:energy-coupling factor transporter ATP-binding protein EcfA2
MPTAFDVRALASTVRIELDDSLSAGDREAIKAQWVDLARDDGGKPELVFSASVREYRELPDGSRMVSASTPDALAQRITQEVTLAAIHGLRGEALMLHASAIALEDGRVVGFVGPSGRGKTTAAQALGGSYGYVTDEALAVRVDGSVLAYPKPLSIGRRPGVKATEAASKAGLRGVPTDELRLAALVLLDRRPDVEHPFVESVPIIEALSALAPQTSHLSALAHPLRTLLETILSTGGVRRVVYSEASTLPPLIDDVIRLADDAAPILTQIPKLSERDCGCFSDAAATPSNPSSIEGDGAYWRASYVDAVSVDDALVVLVLGQVVVLDGVGPVLWLAADGVTESELLEIAMQQLPEPPAGVDVTAIISDAVDGLMKARVMVRV